MENSVYMHLNFRSYGWKITFTFIFGRPLQVMVHPMLWDCCPACLSCLFVCNVGVLLSNGWMDQDAIWYGGKPRPRQLCVRWRSSCPP